MNEALTLLIKNVANLFKVKSIISFMVLGAMTYGFTQALVPVEVYAPLATAVVTYFFTKTE